MNLQFLQTKIKVCFKDNDHIEAIRVPSDKLDTLAFLITIVPEAARPENKPENNDCHFRVVFQPSEQSRKR